MSSAPDKIQTWQMMRPLGKDPETRNLIEGILEKKKKPKWKENESLFASFLVFLLEIVNVCLVAFSS